MFTACGRPGFITCSGHVRKTNLLIPIPKISVCYSVHVWVFLRVVIMFLSREYKIVGWHYIVTKKEEYFWECETF